jgi:4'-phosphopantetheinyl transferase EntD
VGSITHCPGFAAAAVARAQDVAALGIDAEPAGPVPPRFLDRIATATEVRDLARLTGQADGLPWGRILFSAKEAVYKAWFPLAGVAVAPRAVVVRVEPPTRASRSGRGRASGRFTGHVSPPSEHADPGGTGLPGGGQEVTGRWAVRGGLVVAAVVVVAGPHRSAPKSPPKSSAPK